MSTGGQPPMYDPEAVKPMREELVQVGVKELLTPEDVESAIGENSTGISLLVVNSVCGCAAGGARPGVMLSLQNDLIPDNSYSVFAGMEREAVDKARGLMKDVPPSSPCIAIFNEGELFGVLPRQQIEGRSAVEISEALKNAFNQVCSRKGPSISKEEFEKITTQQSCGSQIPKFGGGVMPGNI